MFTLQRAVRHLFPFSFGLQKWDFFKRQKKPHSAVRSFIHNMRVEALEQRALLSIGPANILYLPPQHDLHNLDGYLTGPSAGKPLDIAMNYLKSNAANLGLTADDFSHSIVTDQYTDADTGLTHIYLEQECNGLKVFDANMVVNLTATGCIINVAGGFVPGLTQTLANVALVVSQTSIPSASEALQSLAPTLSASAALESVAAALGLTNSAPANGALAGSTQLTTIDGQDADPDATPEHTVLNNLNYSLDPIPVEMLYVPTGDNSVVLAWEYILRTPDGEHWYDVSADATSGELVGLNDWVDSASYNVFALPVESPPDGSRSIVTDPQISAASPYGWHDTNGVADPEYTDTRGNNVSAQEDVDANNTGGFRPDGTAALNFDFPLNLAQAPSGYQSAAITNLFYWNNLNHDIHYQYGFTEVAGNFQVTNYTGQGLGNDPVQADAQDGSGTNNANFATPPDGQAPRMQMFNFTYTTPNRDGDLESMIITHEYGHGVSNRLVGEPSNVNALTAVQSGGMGEGWGDWWGLMFTQKASDIKLGRYPVGTYVLGESPTDVGIRRYPYSFDMSVNPLTYGNIRTHSEVHDEGEVWCSALWDMNWLLIDKYGFSSNIAAGYSAGAAGNILALKLVEDSLKLMPANPTFLQSRDAILLADRNLTGGVNQTTIWTAFARRGMGYSAVSGSASTTSGVVEAFDMPPVSSRGTVSFSAHSYPIGSSATITVGDSDLSANPSCPVTIASSAGDSETVTLAAQGGGVFQGSILTSAGTVASGNGVLETIAGGTITVTYSDASDGTGHTAVVTDQATTFVPIQVTTTTPPAGGTFALPAPFTYDVTFSAPVTPTSVTTGSLTLSGISGAAVTGVTVMPGYTTVRFTIGGITTEGTLNASIAAGAITDASGNPCAAFSASYAVDFSMVAFPVPLTSVVPAGSLIYTGSASGIVSPSGDTDTFTLPLDTGQTISILVTPNSAGLQSTVQLLDPSGALIGTATAAAAGQNALIQAIGTGTTGGTYKIVVGGTPGSSGNYTVSVTLNAALELEGRIAGAANNSTATAQDAGNSFLLLTNAASGPRRGAILGQLGAGADSDYYSFAVSASEIDTFALMGLSTGNLNLELLNGSGSLIATGTSGATNLAKAISSFNVATPGTYYVRITGDGNVPYSLVIVRNGLFDIEANDSAATAQPIAPSLGQSAALGFIEPIITVVEPDNYASGTTLTSIVPGITLTSVGSTSAVTSQTASYHSTGTRVFSPGTSLTWSDTLNLKAAFSAPVSSVSIDLVADDTNDPGFLKAYNSAGVLLQDLETTAPTYPTPGFLTMTITRPAADIAYVVAGGQAGQVIYLDHLVVNGGASGNDYYKVSARSGDPLQISTSTPAGGANEFVNTLDPKIELYDPSGTLVASDDNASADGRNAKLQYIATTNGDYVVRVLSTNAGTGEYVLSINSSLLSFTVPSDVQENAGMVSGTVNISAPLSSDLVVSLASSDPFRLTVPASVTISAGHTSASLSLTINNNTLLDGIEPVTITATATGYGTGNGVITIHDDESAILTVSLPASAKEGDGILTGRGMVTVNQAPSVDVIVALSSSDTTELAVPATVKILAGQTSATFDVTVVDDTLIDGTQSATVTASVENWTSGSKSMDVLDNDRTLAVNLPADGWEGQTATGNVTIGGTLGTDLVVSLLSNDSSEMTVPSTVTILAGQTTASFNVNLVQDGVRDGKQTAMITAIVVDFPDATDTIDVRDSDLDHFAWDTLGTPKTAGVAFSATVRARNIDNETILVYAGSAVLSGAGGGGTVPVTPGSCALAAGVWTGNVTVNAVSNGVVLTATAAGRTGASNSFNVTSGPLDHFQWSTIASPQYKDVPFTTTLTAVDAHGFTVTNFNSSINLNGFVGSGTGSSIVISEVNTDDTDWIEFTNVTTSAINIVGWQMYVYDWSTWPTPQAVWTFPTGASVPAGGVFRIQEAGTSPGSYPTFYYGTNIYWNNETSGNPVGLLLRDSTGQNIDFFCAVDCTPGTITQPTTIPANQWQGSPVAANSDETLSYYRIGNQDHNNTSDWTIGAKTPGTLNPGLTIPFIGGTTQIAVSPSAITFSNGVWTGNVTALQTATNMYLQASDGSGHVANSNVFNVEALPPLSVSVPTDAREGDGILSKQGVVGIPAALAADFNVTLTSSDASEVTVPGTVTILAGQTSATFDLTVIDDAELDPLQTATITASAAGYVSGHDDITIHDNEMATLTVSLPASAKEGDGILTGRGMVTVNQAPSVDVIVALSSSDTTELAVPATVKILAGQTSATFDVTVVDDTLIDGTQSATVTASVENWTSGSKSMDVLDNDRTLAVNLPADGWEGQTATGNVTIGGTLGTDLVVSLLSNDSSEMTVPSTVTILAGQTTASFNVNLVQDGVRDGKQTAMITAIVVDFPDATDTIDVRDSDLDHFAWDTLGTPKTAGVAFSATVRARNIDNETILVYAGSAVLSGAGGGGTVPVTPGSCALAAGVWTGNVTVNAVSNGVVLTATAAGRTGASNSFNVTSGPLDHFQWSTIASPEYKDMPFTTALTAVDAHGFTVTSYNGSMTLSGLMGGAVTSVTVLGNPTPSNSANYGTYTLGYSFTPSVNVTVTDVLSYYGTKVSIWTNSGQLIVSQAVNNTGGAWVETPLLTPVQLLAGSIYRIAAYTAGQDYYWRTDMSSSSPIGTINQTYWSSGDAFPTLTDAARWFFVDLRGNIGTAISVPISPTTATFTNGVWTGSVTVLQAATGMYLQASDGSGHLANSNNFNVQNSVPLSITVPAEANEGDGVLIGQGVVSISAPLSLNIDVTLTSSDTSELAVPASVTILAGHTSAAFDLTIMDDTVLDPLHVTTITASGAGCISSSTSILIHDNETAQLTVTLPAGAQEGDGVLAGGGVVTVDQAPTVDVTVSLASTDTTEITVPSTVKIPAGHTSAAFDVTVIDDTVIDGTQTAGVTAHVEHWTDDSAQMNVFDDDAFMELAVPTDAWEGDIATGVVFIGGALPSDLVVSLTSLDTSEVTVPATVTITAGQTWATFDIDVVQDGVRDGTQIAHIRAAAMGFHTDTDVIVVHDADLDHFAWDPIASPQIAAVDFSVIVRAENVDNEILPMYAGTANITGAGIGGPVPVTPGACSFVSGIWTGDVNVNAVAKGVVLTMDDGAGIIGSSNAFDVNHGPLDHFLWSTIHSPQYENLPFSATITALDAHGFVVTDFNGTATLNGQIVNSHPIPPLFPVATGDLVIFVQIEPQTATFINGIYTSDIIVLEMAEGMNLHVDDNAGHFGDTNAFSVLRQTLTTSVPANVTEGVGAVTGMVSISTVMDRDLVVSLASGDPEPRGRATQRHDPGGSYIGRFYVDRT